MKAHTDARRGDDERVPTDARDPGYTLFSRRHTSEQRSKHVRSEVSSQVPDYRKITEIVHGRPRPTTDTQ